MTLDRLSRLQTKLDVGQHFYITNLVNIRYLTGFTGSNAALLVSSAGAVLATDSRYAVQASEQVPDLPCLIGRDFSSLLLSGLPKAEVLVEGDSLSMSDYLALCDSYAHQFTGANGIIENMRSVKDDHEINFIRTACDIATTAFLEILPSIKVGQTQKMIRNIL